MEQIPCHKRHVSNVVQVLRDKVSYGFLDRMKSQYFYQTDRIGNREII